MPRLIALMVLSLLPMTAAQAQSAAAIEAHLTRSNPGCDITRPEEAWRGTLPGSGPAVVVIYTLEGCGGGNNSGRIFVVLTERNGNVVALRQSAPPRFAVNAARVTNGVIEVSGLGYGPNDGRCCPSVRRSARFRVADGVVVPAR